MYPYFFFSLCCIIKDNIKFMILTWFFSTFNLFSFIYNWPDLSGSSQEGLLTARWDLGLFPVRACLTNLLKSKYIWVLQLITLIYKHIKLSFLTLPLQASTSLYPWDDIMDHTITTSSIIKWISKLLILIIKYLKVFKQIIYVSLLYKCYTIKIIFLVTTK